jgi:peptidoglycan/LPS O-acetylase OafA/YrhL
MKLSKLKTILSRDTSSGAFIPQIDGLRFIAIGAVICYHIADFVRVKTGHAWEDSTLSLFLSHGYFGVPLFFVISGFVISLPFVQREMAGRAPVPLKRYFLRRLTRLEPPYLINLLLLFSLLILVKDRSAEELFPHLLASMAYSHNAIYNEFSQVNFLAWSLEVEFQFYVLAPLLVWVFRIKGLLLRRVVLIGLMLLFGLIANDLAATGQMPRLSLLYHFSYFFCGFLLADVYVNNWNEEPNTRYLFDLVSVFGWTALTITLYEPDRFRALFPFLIFIAYWAAFRGRVSSWFFSQPLIYIIGGMCYTLYLYHFFVISAVGNPVLRWLENFTEDQTLLTIYILLTTVPFVLASGAVLFVCFEKPFMRRDWFESLFQRITRTNHQIVQK